MSDFAIRDEVWQFLQDCRLPESLGFALVARDFAAPPKRIRRVP